MGTGIYFLIYTGTKKAQYFRYCEIQFDSNVVTYYRYNNTKYSSLVQFEEVYDKAKDQDIELEKLQLIEAAASLIKSEVKEKVTTRKDIYPPVEKLSRENSLCYVPSLLRLLLSKMFSSGGADTDLKVAAIGQCIIHSANQSSHATIADWPCCTIESTLSLAIFN